MGLALTGLHRLWPTAHTWSAPNMPDRFHRRHCGRSGVVLLSSGANQPVQTKPLYFPLFVSLPAVTASEPIQLLQQRVLVAAFAAATSDR